MICKERNLYTVAGKHEYTQNTTFRVKNKVTCWGIQDVTLKILVRSCDWEPKPEFNEFESRLKSAKNGFNLAPA